MQRKKALWLMLFMLLIIVTSYAQQTLRPQTPDQIDIYNFDPLEDDDEDVTPYLEKATDYYQQGKFQQAAQYYLAYLAEEDDDADSWYNLACCYGLLGSPVEAAKYLKISYKKGYKDLDHISKDKDFDQVRTAKTFTMALDSLKVWSENEAGNKGKMGYFPIRQYGSYYLYLPQDYDAKKSYTLLIGMHGLGGVAHNFGGLWQYFKDKNIIYVVPEAPYAFPESKNSAFSWGPFVPMESKAMETSYGWVQSYVTGLAKKLQKKYNVKETWLLGFSQGAYFGYLLTLKNPDVFDGLVACGGGLKSENINNREFKKAKNLEVIISHGKQDRVVQYSESETAYNTLLQKKIPVTFIPFEGEHRVSKTALDAFLERIK